MGGKPSAPFDPTTIEAAVWRYGFIGFRVLGAVVVVAFMEEIFWRGFLIRWMDNRDFKRVPIGTFSWKSFGITVLFFSLDTSGGLPAWFVAPSTTGCTISARTSFPASWPMLRGTWH